MNLLQLQRRCWLFYCLWFLGCFFLEPTHPIYCQAAEVATVDDCLESVPQLDANQDGWLQKDEYIILVEDHLGGCYEALNLVDAMFLNSASFHSGALQINLAKANLGQFCSAVVAAIPSSCLPPTKLPTLPPTVATTTTDEEDTLNKKDIRTIPLPFSVTISSSSALLTEHYLRMVLLESMDHLSLELFTSMTSLTQEESPESPKIVLPSIIQRLVRLDGVDNTWNVLGSVPINATTLLVLMDVEGEAAGFLQMFGHEWQYMIQNEILQHYVQTQLPKGITIEIQWDDSILFTSSPTFARTGAPIWAPTTPTIQSDTEVDVSHLGLPAYAIAFISISGIFVVVTAAYWCGCHTFCTDEKKEMLHHQTNKENLFGVREASKEESYEDHLENENLKVKKSGFLGIKSSDLKDSALADEGEAEDDAVTEPITPTEAGDFDFSARHDNYYSNYGEPASVDPSNHCQRCNSNDGENEILADTQEQEASARSASKDSREEEDPCNEYSPYPSRCYASNVGVGEQLDPTRCYPPPPPPPGGMNVSARVALSSPPADMLSPQQGPPATSWDTRIYEEQQQDVSLNPSDNEDSSSSESPRYRSGFPDPRTLEQNQQDLIMGPPFPSSAPPSFGSFLSPHPMDPSFCHQQQYQDGVDDFDDTDNHVYEGVHYGEEASLLLEMKAFNSNDDDDAHDNVYYGDVYYGSDSEEPPSSYPQRDATSSRGKGFTSTYSTVIKSPQHGIVVSEQTKHPPHEKEKKWQTHVRNKSLATLTEEDLASERVETMAFEC